MISALEQYAALARAEFDCPFQVGHSGNVYLHPDRSPMAPSVYHDDDTDIEIESDQWEAFSIGYTGQHGYNGAVMHSSEQLSGRLADDILTTPGTYVIVAVNVLPDDNDTDPAPAGWAVLKLKED